MFVACGIWCLADVSSVSSSSEQTGELSDQTRQVCLQRMLEFWGLFRICSTIGPRNKNNIDNN